MSTSVVERPPAIPLLPVGAQVSSVSRPQVGINRLPTRRMSNEPRESMNCKSCRKRKIKCNRLRPACEACQVFQVPCIYDAVPKKRGPKTDVLESLLKRVDGLEQQLKGQKKDETGNDASNDSANASTNGPINGPSVTEPSPTMTTATATSGDTTSASNARMSADDTTVDSEKLAHTPSREPRPTPNGLSSPSNFATTLPTQNPVVPTEALLSTYFTRFHAKPFHVLDESSFRHRLQTGQVPPYLIHAVCALSSRFTPHPNGYKASVKLGEEYAAMARAEVDTDEPSVDCLQALLLLCLSFNASGKGNKAYMVLTNAIGMAMALELHREMDAQAKVMPVEREMRRRLFWTCYLLDRYMASGSRRPSLISDRTILLRLPCWSPGPSSMPIEGDFFQSASNLQHLQGGGGKMSQGSSGMLIDITRILGITNQYMAAGGVKGDSHFPWHSLSNLSKIRQDLDIWASGSQDIFSSVEVLFSQPDSSTLVLSKLVYHLIHCLIYRPFLPVDLAELSGSGQHQSWQIEATNMCFLHANAIAELVALGKRMPQVEWAGFVGYCICTAGTVHIHGAHYSKSTGGGEMNVFSSSAEFLSREMQQLDELRYKWACVQHHRETLQSICNAHTELIKTLGNNPVRYTPVFHLDDFFDRYSNIGGPTGVSLNFDTANLSLSDVVDYPGDTYTGLDGYSPNSYLRHISDTHSNAATGVNASVANTWDDTSDRPNLKRKKIAPSIMIPNNATSGNNGSSMPSQLQSPFSAAFSAQPTPSLTTSPNTMGPPSLSHPGGLGARSLDASPATIASSASFSPLSPQQAHAHAAPQQQQSPPQPEHQQTLAAPFDPNYNFSALAVTPNARLGAENGSNPGPGNSAQGMDLNPTADVANVDFGGYDPMFGIMPEKTFTSPSPWTSEEVGGLAKPVGVVLYQSPGDQSNDGSAGGTTAGDEKDPFLSLLEQLAENEYARGFGSSELDLFLSGAPNST